jgi:hypothetical protein
MPLLKLHVWQQQKSRGGGDAAGGLANQLENTD